MAALPYMQLYVADYLADTAHLSTIENGAYLLLIFNYWQRGESFKAKDERSLNGRLAAVARMSNEEWESVKESLAEFFEITPTEWKHARIERDLESVNAKSEQAKAAGRASAAKKMSGAVKDKPASGLDLQGCGNGRLTDAQRSFNHTDKDTDTDINKTKEKIQKEKSASPLALLTQAGVSASLANDFLAIRKAKKAPLTETAIAGIEREARKAGKSLSEAIAICCERGWQGFDASWLLNASRAGPSQKKSLGEAREETIAALTGREIRNLGNESNIIDITPTAILAR